MKTKRLFLTILLIAIVLIGNKTIANAQNGNGEADYYTISGVVKDKNSKRTIEYVNISAVGTNVGTITNEDGEFALKINKSLNVNEIRLSCIGYYNALIAVTRNNENGKTFFLTPESFHLSEVLVFSWRNPRDLVKAAIEKIEDNYELAPNKLTGFYRETIQKRRKYITISEAVVELYKGPYNQSVDRDQVKILKGRKLISPKKADTLSVKFAGGPNMPIYLDIVKNPDIVLEKEMLQYYAFRMGETTSIDDRLQFVVHFEPQMITEYPLYTGTLYIDRTNLSFTRTEFKMDMRDKQKVTDVILQDKPKGLRFTPEEVSYIVTYKQSGEKTYLNYIRNEIRFKCDWKRKLFVTNYAVCGETIITDRSDQQVTRIPAKEAFTIRQSLSQEVALYQDENYWSNYNIIEPTESLENAVNKLKKQHLKSQ